MRVILILVFIFFTHSAVAGERICGRSVTGTIEVLIETTSLGMTEGFRLTNDGILSHAQWSRDHRLVGLSSPVTLGRDAFANASRALQGVEPALPDFGNADTPKLPQQTGLSIAIMQHRPGDETGAIFRDRPDATLDGLLETWKALAPLRPPARGVYVWAVRVPRTTWKPDLKLTSRGCGEAAATGVAGALTGPSIVIGAAEDVLDFITDGQSRRPRFLAKVPRGFASFGVLQAD